MQKVRDRICNRRGLTDKRVIAHFVKQRAHRYTVRANHLTRLGAMMNQALRRPASALLTHLAKLAVCRCMRYWLGRHSALFVQYSVHRYLQRFENKQKSLLGSLLCLKAAAAATRVQNRVIVCAQIMDNRGRAIYVHAPHSNSPCFSLRCRSRLSARSELHDFDFRMVLIAPDCHQDALNELSNHFIELSTSPKR